jgi:hypothetical protein
MGGNADSLPEHKKRDFQNCLYHTKFQVLQMVLTQNYLEITTELLWLIFFREIKEQNYLSAPMLPFMLLWLLRACSGRLHRI